MSELTIYGGAGSATANLRSMRAAARRLDALADALVAVHALQRPPAGPLIESQWASRHTAATALARLQELSAGGQHNLRDLARDVATAAEGFRAAADTYAGTERDAQRDLALVHQVITLNPALAPLALALKLAAMTPGVVSLRVMGFVSQLRTQRGEAMHRTIGELARFLGTIPGARWSPVTGADKVMSPGELAGQLSGYSGSRREASTMIQVMPQGTTQRDGPTIGYEGLALRAGHLHPASNPEASGDYRIEVDVMIRADGTRAFGVHLPGLQIGGSDTNPAGIAHALEAVTGRDSAITQAIAESLKLAGAKPGDDVVLSGHSAGGMAAVAFAGTAAGKSYNIKAVTSFGSPVGLIRVPANVQAMHIDDKNDPVPGMDGTHNPVTPNRVTVLGRGSLRDAPAPRNAAESAFTAHHIPVLADLGRQIDETAGEPSISAHRETLSDVAKGVVHVETKGYVVSEMPKPPEALQGPDLRPPPSPPPHPPGWPPEAKPYPPPEAKPAPEGGMGPWARYRGR